MCVHLLGHEFVEDPGIVLVNFHEVASVVQGVIMMDLLTVI